MSKEAVYQLFETARESTRDGEEHVEVLGDALVEHNLAVPIMRLLYDNDRLKEQQVIDEEDEHFIANQLCTAKGRVRLFQINNNVRETWLRAVQAVLLF